jgi:tetratricopeptide (TPR) repeat protein
MNPLGPRLRPAPFRRTHLRYAAALLAALLACVPASARADDDDGGTRSLFAAPAGSRGTALGGAFVAVPGDGSIAAWNPGGLGWAPRSEASVSTVSYDLGFREDFAAFVLPSWRIGAASIAIRRFGTTGIDGRDDRNVPTGEDLSSSETEVTLAYGRTFGSAIGVGGAVKLQRQSVAGRSGSGLGADLGVTLYPLLALHVPARWAPQLTWGLGIRNLAQPKIRLDQESVRDPSVRRTGFAYRTPFALATLDLETGGGARPRLHAGAEVSARPFLALRAGMNGDAITAGAGFRVRGIALDYAFEDRAYDPVHRIGLSYAFGPTTVERREAFLRAEDEKLQARLAEAFQRVQRERIQALLSRAEEARSAGVYGEAIEILGTIGTLDPENAEAADLEVRCLREQGAKLEQQGDLAEAAVAYGRLLEKRPQDPDARIAQGRCRAESDRRSARSAEIRKAFAQAMDAFASDDLIAARNGFAAVVRDAPNDEDARAMLRRTRAALSRRAQALLGDARRSLAERRLDSAAGLLEEARSLDPGAEGLAPLAAALERARPVATARTPEPARTAPPQASGLPESDVREFYRRGLAALAAKRSADALRYFELVWSANPKYQRVADYLKREYLIQGLDAYAAGRLDEAVAHWERALTVDPSDPRARGYLTRARQQLERSREVAGDTP